MIRNTEADDFALTIKDMLSNEFEDRMFAEWEQLIIRISSIAHTIYLNKRGDIKTPEYQLLKQQYDIMKQYQSVLEERAERLGFSRIREAKDEQPF